MRNEEDVRVEARAQHIVLLHGIVGHEETDREREKHTSYQIGDDRRYGIEVARFEGRHANRGDGLENTVDRVEKEIRNGKEDEPQEEVLASNNGG